MALPESDNIVNTTRLSSTLNRLWDKTKTKFATKADDSAVVHKAGEEVITGRKVFQESVALSQYDSGENGYNIKCLGDLSVTQDPYSNWPEEAKDGHHYREWEIAVPYSVSMGEIRVTLTALGGVLQRTIRVDSCNTIVGIFSAGTNPDSLGGNNGYYTIADNDISSDFRISDLLWDSSLIGDYKFVIKIRSMHPERNVSIGSVIFEALGDTTHFEDVYIVSNDPQRVTGETYEVVRRGSVSSPDPSDGITIVETVSWLETTKIQNCLGKDILVDGDIVQSSNNGNLSVLGTDVEVYSHPTQTAYTSKGTATKVPQITTDSTGHVTSISEVTISGVTPSSHASTATTYGIGTTSTYGHVKLATGDMNGASNTDGVAVSKNHTHSQYAPKASPALTGTPTAPTAADGTNTTQIATTAFVQSAVAQGLSVSDAMVYKGTVTLGATSPGGLTVAADKGHTYKVVANGNTKEGYVDGVKVEAGDMVICNTDSTAAATASNYSTIAAKWDFVQGNTDGVVVGPASATSGNVVLFDGATGKLVQDGGKLGTAAFKDVASSGNASTTQVVMGNDTRLTDSRTPTSHTHGNLTNGGALQTNDITVANGDKLVVTDASDSNKVARTSVSFDGSTTTKALTPKGTFESFAKAGDITTAIQALDVSSVGGAGKYISAISETDGKISATTTTMDTTPTASSTNAVTSGGIKTALDAKANIALDNVTAKSLANLYSKTDGYASHSNKAAGYGLLATIDYSDHPGYSDTNVVFELYDKQANQVFTGKRYLVVNIRNSSSSSGASGTYVYKVTELIQAPVWERLSLKVYRTDNTDIRIYSLGAGTSSYGGMVCKLVSCTGWTGESKYTKITMHQGESTNTVPSGTEMPITIVTEDYSAIPDTYRSIIQDISKGANLLVNGSGRMSSNYNFSGFTYLPTICYNGSAGSFGFNGTNESNEFISCDFNKKIVFSADVKNLVAQPSNCVHRIYIAEYDIDKNIVYARNVMYGVGTLTELTQNLNPGDTVVHLADLSNENWLSATSYHRGFIFWNYQNSYGYLYPPETYSRNVYPIADSNPLWDVANVNVSAGTITLNSAWAGPAIPAGTKVSRRSSGGTFPYPATITTGDTEWHSLKGYAKGIVAPGTSERVPTKFSQGTAFIKVGMLPSNLSNTDTVTSNRAVVTNFFVYEEQDINDGFGTLPITRGGTGATTKNAAEYAINGNMAQATDAMSDHFQFVFSRVGSAQNATNGVFIYRTASTIWDYMKDKIKADSHCLVSDDAIDIWNSI